jgi:hypothetical protein
VSEHFCGGRWVAGAFNECGSHSRIRARPSVIPLQDRNRITVEGVAKSGQVSSKGTVKHREWFDGRVDAKANVRPVTGKLSEMRKRA